MSQCACGAKRKKTKIDALRGAELDNKISFIDTGPDYAKLKWRRKGSSGIQEDGGSTLHMSLKYCRERGSGILRPRSRPSLVSTGPPSM